MADIKETMERIAKEVMLKKSDTSTFISNQVTMSTATGMGVVLRIVESATEGKYAVVLFDDSKTKENCHLGPSALVVHDRVSVVGGRVCS